MITGNLEEALSYIDVSYQINPKDSYTVFLKAKILFKLKQYDKALYECNQLLKTIRNEDQIFELIGDIYASKNMKSEAY